MSPENALIADRSELLARVFLTRRLNVVPTMEEVADKTAEKERASDSKVSSKADPKDEK